MGGRVALADLGGDENLEVISSKDGNSAGGTPMGRHEILIAKIPAGGACSNEPCELSLSRCYDWLPPEWRKGKNSGISGSPVVADIDGDGNLEIILTSPARGVFIWEPAYDQGSDSFTCQAELGWPLRLLEEATTPVVADVDKDQCLELVIGDQSGLLHLFDLPGACVVEAPWPMAGANTQRTHNFGDPAGFRGSSGPEIAGVGLLPGHPNPFNPSVVLRFQMPYRAHATVAVFDAAGREVVRLHDRMAEAGLNEVVWDGHDQAGRSMASGTYFARFVIAGYEMSRKLVLVK